MKLTDPKMSFDWTWPSTKNGRAATLDGTTKNRSYGIAALTDIEREPMKTSGYERVRFENLPGTPCPCGTARRAFEDVADFPGTIHVTEIALENQLHYHRQLTETYYFLECEPGSQMQLDQEILDVQAGDCILIRPGTRHRAIGKMKVLIVVYPKFDPSDEWFDA